MKKWLSKLMQELFRATEDHAPSIVFIDEIDVIGTKTLKKCVQYS